MIVSAYIPCFNNRETLPQVIASVHAQNVVLKELLVIDDGSVDGSAEHLESLGVEVLRQSGNFGRGAARARAMQRVCGEFVLSVDATNLLPIDFLEKALRWFDSAKVAAVFGRIREDRNRTAVERWRGRHLFKNDVPFQTSRQASLITYGTVVRRSAVEAVGGYDSSLRHTEDAELGERLLKAGYDVVFDPELEIRSIAQNSVVQVLERYWRWHVGKAEHTNFRGYLSQISYSVKVMAREDLRHGDPLATGISLLSPHYGILRSLGVWKRLQFHSPTIRRCNLR